MRVFVLEACIRAFPKRRLQVLVARSCILTFPTRRLVLPVLVGRWLALARARASDAADSIDLSRWWIALGDGPTGPDGLGGDDFPGGSVAPELFGASEGVLRLPFAVLVVVNVDSLWRPRVTLRCVLRLRCPREGVGCIVLAGSYKMAAVVDGAVGQLVLHGDGDDFDGSSLFGHPG